MAQMKRFVKYIYIISLTLVLCGCLSSCLDDDFLTDTKITELRYDENGNLIARIGLEIPEMMNASTRALAESPDLANLNLYLLVFSEGEGLVQFTTISHDDIIEDTQHSNEGLVTFQVVLEPTERPTVIHVIATSDLEFGAQIAYGVEEQIVPTLYSSKGNEALWQRIDLLSNIPSQENIDPSNKEEYSEIDVNNAKRIMKLMTHIPMIRNYCKVSVGFGDDFTQSGMKITELYVLNTPDRGNVAPYRAIFTPDGNEMDYFVPYYREDNGKYIPRTYRDITDNDLYVGGSPTGIEIINTLDQPDKIETKSISPEGKPAPVYFYESPARTNSLRRTYAIIGIESKWQANKDPYTSYYKIDLGNVRRDLNTDLREVDQTNGGLTDNVADFGLFEYYNLLRNFNFEIKVHSVNSEGYNSLQDAGNGSVFNNISTSVEAKSMKSMSDGEDWIYVDKTSFVFTEKDQEVTFKVQFRENIGNGDGRINNDVLKVAYDGNNDIFEVVKVWKLTAAEAKAAGEEVGEYLYIKVKCKGEPNKELPHADLYVYRGNKAPQGQPKNYGLYRVITLYMHEPWPYKNVDTFPGLWNDMNENPWDWSENTKREVGQDVGSPLTLFFEIPGDLPQDIFPLEFVIESERQNIQNAYQGNAVVRSVPAKESLFYENWTSAIGQPKSSRIQYVKTVTWFDYNNNSWDIEYNGPKNTLVRCRFLTITDLGQDGVGGTGNTSSSITNIRIKSDPLYFGTETPTGWLSYAEDGFERKYSTSDPSPRFWDFSSGIWDHAMDYMSGGSRSQLSNDESIRRHTEVDALYFIEGSLMSMSNRSAFIGEDMVYERYVRCSNLNDIFRHEHTYDNQNARKIRVKVVSTDDAGNPVAPRVVLTGVKRGTTNMANVTASRVESADETLPDGKKVFVFDVTVEKEVTTLNVDIMPSQTAMRFYKIDFFPRWDEQAPSTSKPRKSSKRYRH